MIAPHGLKDMTKGDRSRKCQNQISDLSSCVTLDHNLFTKKVSSFCLLEKFIFIFDKFYFAKGQLISDLFLIIKSYFAMNVRNEIPIFNKVQKTYTINPASLPLYKYFQTFKVISSFLLMCFMKKGEKRKIFFPLKIHCANLLTVEGHLSPGLFSPHLQSSTFQS